MALELVPKRSERKRNSSTSTTTAGYAVSLPWELSVLSKGTFSVFFTKSVNFNKIDSSFCLVNRQEPLLSRKEGPGKIK